MTSVANADEELDELLDVEAPADVPVLELLLDAVEELALVPPPLTLSPTTPPTDATVPATGARSTVWSSVRCALARATCA